MCMKFKIIGGLVALILPILTYAGRPFDAFDFASARARALAENKMILVYFTGEWCAPCKWMNGTTFADKEVQAALAENCISIASDIDTPEGFQLRTSFGIRYLPTLLIFDSQGHMLRKTEETVSPRGMLELINSCKIQMEEGIQKQTVNKAPSLSDNNAENTADDDNDKPFRVQVGVFTRYDGAGDLVQMLRQSIEEPIMVITESRDDTLLFRVQVGRFASLKEAEQLKVKMKSDMNIDGIVRHVM
jgi:thioredoxin 1